MPTERDKYFLDLLMSESESFNLQICAKGKYEKKLKEGKTPVEAYNETLYELNLL